MHRFTVGQLYNWLRGRFRSPSEPVHSPIDIPAQSAANEAQEQYGRVLRDLLAVEPWCVDDIQLTENTIQIKGWAIAPHGDHSQVTITINDHAFDSVEFPLHRADIEHLLWYMPGAERSGFVCRLNKPHSDLFASGSAVFSYVKKATGQPLRKEHNYYYYDTLTDDLVIPPAQNRRRVHGAESESAFRLEGYTTFVKLQQALQQYVQRDYTDFGHILDWGCGCGRVTRYFRNIPHSQITGIDIDADNVQWCAANLPFGRFEAVPLHPPTQLSDATFDLLLGISVFTHLKEREQFEWLDELRRIAASGAIVLMTVLSDATSARSGLPYELWSSWKSTGFLDAGHNPDLAGSLDVQEYYRNTFYTHAYIQKHWTTYFEIITIVPGYIGNHQDLVIMRKR